MAWMDMSIAVILVIYMIKGWNKGVVLSFLSMLSFIFAGIISKMYHPVVSRYMIENPMIFSQIKQFIFGKLNVAISRKSVTEGILAERNVFQILRFPKELEQLFINNDIIKDVSGSMIENGYDYISDLLTRMFISFMSMIVVFFVIKMILFVIGYLLDGVFSLPVLKQLNHVAGMTFGFVKGMMIVFIIFTIITPFVTMGNSSVLIEGIEKSVAARVLYDNNPIIGIIKVIVE